MAIAFSAVTDASGVSTHTGAATPVACPAPAGRAVNDVLLCTIQDSSGTATITTPSGWTIITGSPTTSSTHSTWVYARVADGTSADDFSATITGPQQWLADMVAYSGCDVSNGLTSAIVAQGVNNSGSTTETVHVSPSVTTPSIANCALVGVYTEDSVNNPHAFSGNSTSPSIGTPNLRADVNEATQKQDMGIMDAFNAAASTAYTMSANLASAEVINCIIVVLAPQTTVAIVRTASDILNAIVDVARPYRKAAFQLNAFQHSAFQVAGGVALIRTATDALSALSDSAVRQAQLRARTATDSISALSETAVRLLTNPRTAADSLSALSETVLRNAQSFSRTATDSLSALSDSTLRQAINYIRTAADNARAYSTVVLKKNPVGYWKLDDSGSTAVDLSGNGNHGAIGTTGITKQVPGAVDSADPGNFGMTFDGALSGKIDVPYSPILNPAIFSVEGWFVGGPLGNCPVIECRPASSGPTAAGFDLFIGTSGANPVAGLSICSANVSQTLLTFVMTPDSWHHLVGTYDGTQARLYVDGVLRFGPTTCPFTPNPSRLTAIAHLNNGGNYVTGTLDEIALYDHVLTLTEVQENYNTGLQKFDNATRLTLALRAASDAIAAITEATTTFKGFLRTATDTIGAISDSAVRQAQSFVRTATDSARHYRSVVLADNPIAGWGLDDSGSTAFDNSGKGNIGTYTGSGVTKGVSGAVDSADPGNKAASFDGTGQVTIPDVPSLRFTGTSPFSIEGWVNPTSVGLNSFPRIYSKEHFAPTRFGILLAINENGSGINAAGNRWDSGNFLGGVSSAAGTVPVSSWTHIIWTYDGTNHRIYINGTIRNTSGTDTGSLGSTTDSIALANIATGGGNLNGVLDEVWIYDYALDATKVSNHYNAGLALFDSPSRFTLALRTASDALAAITEATTIVKGIARTAADTLNALSDSAVRVVYSRARTADDTLSSLSDSAVRQAQNISRIATDSLAAITEATTVVKGIARTATDTIGALSDNAVRQAQFKLRTATDSLNALSDTANRNFQSFLRTATDSLNAITESNIVQKGFVRTALDTIGAISDTTVRKLTVNRTASDTITSISDTALRRAQSFLRTALDFINAIIDSAFNVSGAPIDLEAITWSPDGIGEVYSASGDDVWSADGTGEIITRDEH